MNRTPMGLDMSRTAILFLALFLAGWPVPARSGTALAPVETGGPGSLARVFPPATGWPGQRLEEIRGLASSFGSTSLIILHQGRLVAEWGETAKRTSSHSVRKSLINSLLGLAREKGLLSLDQTLGELGIDDRQDLSETEKKATIRDLLMSKSGVYHPAAAESEGMKKARPARHSHLPGTHFYYNNWDFNVLGTIFRRRTSQGIGEAFQEWIARPLDMDDFRPRDVRVSYEDCSIHPAYPFYISARDLARFGQLYLQKGLWRGRRVLPAQWIEESTSAYTYLDGIGYGYLWWTYLDQAYYAHGFGGQFVVVAPGPELVVVNRVDSGKPGPERRQWLKQGQTVDRTEMERIVKTILAGLPRE